MSLTNRRAGLLRQRTKNTPSHPEGTRNTGGTDSRETPKIPQTWGWGASFAPILTLAVAFVMLFACTSFATAQPGRSQKMIGMYIHQHWPYNHPYAARTWTLEDWRGYADGMKQIGYNTFLLWPMLEIMPDPLTPSDRANLSKLNKVIDMLHNEMGMRVYIVICPNIHFRKGAARATFETRHYYWSDEIIDPADPAALSSLVTWREKLMKPLAKVDGVAIIDSDPGGWPGSTNADFVRLLGEHRKMLDRVRPGIELIYWMHAGWQGWSRFYETGKLLLGTPEEQQDVLTRVKALNPEPWGIANGLPYAEKLGIADKVVRFNYGLIEGEPSFPMTNFGNENTYKGAGEAGPRGVMGNAQTHCVQLPNTFAFVRGALGLPFADADYVEFAEGLIPGQGREIVDAWRTLQGQDAAKMRATAAELEALPDAKLAPGRLKGLLFGSARRFVTDLALQLRLRAALEEISHAPDSGPGLKSALANLVSAAEAWQRRHGYQNNWYDPRLHTALRKLHSPAVDKVLNITYEAKPPFADGQTAPQQVAANFAAIETYTTQLLAAMKTALKELH